MVSTRAAVAKSRELAILDEARRLLMESGSLEDIKSVRDRAEAIRQYAQSAALGLELQNRAAEVKLLAERRAGELTSKGLLRFARAQQASSKTVIHARRTFPCIYANPPWNLDLAKLPVKDLAEANAHLHLWVPPERLQDGLCVVKAWGFRYATFLVWRKRQPGFGRYWKQAHEALLLGVRGNLPFRDNSLPSLIEGSEADRARIVRQLIERVSPGPRLDLFGHGKADGWTFGTKEQQSL